MCSILHGIWICRSNKCPHHQRKSCSSCPVANIYHQFPCGMGGQFATLGVDWFSRSTQGAKWFPSITLPIAFLRTLWTAKMLFCPCPEKNKNIRCFLYSSKHYFTSNINEVDCKSWTADVFFYSVRSSAHLFARYTQCALGSVKSPGAFFYKNVLTWILAWMSNHFHNDVWWNYLSIPKLQWCNHWSLGIYK